MKPLDPKHSLKVMVACYIIIITSILAIITTFLVALSCMG